MKTSGQIYAAGVTTAGVIVFLTALSRWYVPDAVLFGIYVAAAAALSAVKIRVPGGNATVTAGFVVLLLSGVQLGWQATVVLAGICGLSQSFLLSQKRPTAIQAGFNFASLVLSSLLAVSSSTLALGQPNGNNLLASLMLMSTLLFLANLFLVSLVISLSSGSRWADTVRRCNFSSFPFYCTGAAVAFVALTAAPGGKPVVLLTTVLVMLSAISFYRDMVGLWAERLKQ